MNVRTLYFSVFALTIALPCAGAPTLHRIDCPAEIPLKTIAIISAPTGWTPFYPFEYRRGMQLNSAGLMWGPPSSMTMAKPTSSEKGIEKWDDIRAGGEKWMACYYGSETGYPDAILSKRIDDKASTCTVIYPKDKSDSRLQITCKW